jgi:hypothetical protein
MKGLEPSTFCMATRPESLRLGRKGLQTRLFFHVRLAGSVYSGTPFGTRSRTQPASSITSTTIIAAATLGARGHGKEGTAPMQTQRSSISGHVYLFAGQTRLLVEGQNSGSPMVASAPNSLHSDR